MSWRISWEWMWLPIKNIGSGSADYFGYDRLAGIRAFWKGCLCFHINLHDPRAFSVRLSALGALEVMALQEDEGYFEDEALVDLCFYGRKYSGSEETFQPPKSIPLPGRR